MSACQLAAARSLHLRSCQLPSLLLFQALFLLSLLLQLLLVCQALFLLLLLLLLLLHHERTLLPQARHLAARKLAAPRRLHTCSCKLPSPLLLPLLLQLLLV